jgi:hypothetical protein
MVPKNIAVLVLKAIMIHPPCHISAADEDYYADQGEEEHGAPLFRSNIRAWLTQLFSRRTGYNFVVVLRTSPSSLKYVGPWIKTNMHVRAAALPRSRR